MQILCDHFFSSSGHHFRFILKGSTSKGPQDYHFGIIQCSNIQNPCQSLLMNFKKFFITDFYSMITIILIESIAWPFPQVRRYTGDDIYIIPVFLIHQLRMVCICLKYSHIRRIDDICIIDRIFRITMRIIKPFHHLRYT